ncbi:TetR family transcriptional regulator [Phenylobacterium sp.]|uniref:TetR family transcriptional regulator n=1 Tax=Phenylobacterium sp. TaxID=1871053 RepID=UPI0035B0A83E
MGRAIGKVQNRAQNRVEAGLRERLVAATLARIAEKGVRGATLRDVGADCDINAATVVAMFENKEGLVAECFAEAAAADALYLDGVTRAAAELPLTPALLADFLWTLIEDAAAARRGEALVLIELLLLASSAPRYAEICRGWLAARRSAFERLAEIAEAPAGALRALDFYLLTEMTFALSAFPSQVYRMNARLGLAEAADRLLGRAPPPERTAEIARLAASFYVDPGPLLNLPDLDGRQARGEESRAKIIDAAAAIIEEDGLSAVTNRAVAERAGVSLALTTYHFDSVHALAYAAALRVFQKANRRLESGEGGSGFRTRREVADYVRSAAWRSGAERVRSRGMVEISQAAARAQAYDGLGLGMRRQRGTITFLAMKSLEGGGPTRQMAAAYAMWNTAAALAADAVGGDAPGIDLTAEASFAADRLLRP